MNSPATIPHKLLRHLRAKLADAERIASCEHVLPPFRCRARRRAELLTMEINELEHPTPFRDQCPPLRHRRTDLEFATETEAEL
jgi:hypothetical protein